MKHIGIAAVTAEGAALVYKRICSFSATRLGDHCHPEISLHSFSFSEHLNAGPNRNKKWAELITQSAMKLHASGADFMVCPSNTPHDVYSLVTRLLPFPWLHIASPVRAIAETNKLDSVLLIGTKFTIESDMYDKEFSGSGIELVKPDTREAAQIHQYITSELVSGYVSAQSKVFFSQLLRTYAGKGIGGVILGCTELPLVITRENCPLPIIDSTIALADAAVEYAVELPK